MSQKEREPSSTCRIVGLLKCKPLEQERALNNHLTLSLFSSQHKEQKNIAKNLAPWTPQELTRAQCRTIFFFFQAKPVTWDQNIHWLSQSIDPLKIQARKEATIYLREGLREEWTCTRYKRQLWNEVMPPTHKYQRMLSWKVFLEKREPLQLLPRIKRAFWIPGSASTGRDCLSEEYFK